MKVLYTQQTQIRFKTKTKTKIIQYVFYIKINIVCVIACDIVACVCYVSGVIAHRKQHMWHRNVVSAINIII